MHAVVDTNVAVVANGKAEQAIPACVLDCVRFIRELTTTGILVLDDRWRIINEYKHNLDQSGQPGVGDGFLRWVLTNQMNPQHCERVSITPTEDSFAEFPDDPRLATFDRSDHKFVAVAHIHPEHPPIYNAVDSDWWEHDAVAVFASHNIQIINLCPEQTSNV